MKQCSSVCQAPEFLPAALPTSERGCFLRRPWLPRAAAAGTVRPSVVRPPSRRSCTRCSKSCPGCRRLCRNPRRGHAGRQPVSIFRMNWVPTPMPGCLPNIGCPEAEGWGGGCFYLMSLNSVQFQEMLGASALTTRKGNNLYWGPTTDQALY